MVGMAHDHVQARSYATSLKDAASEASALAGLLQEHAWIARCWLSSFVLDGLWDRLPSGWQQALLELPDEDLARLPTSLPIPESWPDGLCKFLRLARGEASDHTPSCAAALDLAIAAEPTAAAMSRWHFSQVAKVRNMSPKKQHEVMRLAPLIARVARQCGATMVVDLGSGLGYLSLVSSE
jgi:hypothetical protein